MTTFSQSFNALAAAWFHFITRASLEGAIALTLAWLMTRACRSAPHRAAGGGDWPTSNFSSPSPARRTEVVLIPTGTALPRGAPVLFLRPPRSFHDRLVPFQPISPMHLHVGTESTR